MSVSAKKKSANRLPNTQGFQRGHCLGLVSLLCGILLAPQSHSQEIAPPAERPDEQWRTLFDGKSLDGWEESDFGGQGEVAVEDGKLILDFGYPLTGVRLREKFPTTDYQLQLEARREQGSDFFCGLTFPVGEGHATLILGGWGGALAGLSSIDGLDASENDTRQFIAFEPHRWYQVRISVTAQHIQVDLDGKPLIRQVRAGHRFTTRPEVDRSKPLGIAAFETLAEIRNIQWRPVR
jgi:hypothetical protein